MQFKQFRRAVRTALRGLGAIEIKPAQFTVETSVGDLLVAPCNGWVRCQFVEPTRARTKVLCNPHSGRWHLLRQSNETYQEFVADIERSLRNLMVGIAIPPASKRNAL